MATILAFNEYGIEMVPNAKARCLAAALARKDQQLIDHLLYKEKQISFPDLLKALNILDSNREIKSIRKKIEINAKTKTVMKGKKLGKLNSNIHNLEKIKLRRLL